eukprot:TRINITY_DN358_c3_g1_i2.p1 TRINITY_DN358_c3_g1~~TRINITY_DN358_c3_g1_i2.p1  ORF type:complete len:3008 (+),score=723.07 TRINITY_DN358_c3_g1_i2:889-9024(+)
MDDSLTLEIHENTLYVSDEATGLYIFNIETPSTPRRFKDMFAVDPPTDTFIGDNGIAYVLRGGYMSVVDITTKSVPLVITAPAEIYSRGVDIAVEVLANNSKTAYIIDDEGLLHVIDVTDPFTPVVGVSIDFSGNDEEKVIAIPYSSVPASESVIQPKSKPHCMTLPVRQGILMACNGLLQLVAAQDNGNYTVTILEPVGVVSFHAVDDKVFVLKTDGLSVFDWTDENAATSRGVHTTGGTPTTPSVPTPPSTFKDPSDISHLKPVFLKLFRHLADIDINLADYSLGQTDLPYPIDAKSLVSGLKGLVQMNDEVERYFDLFTHLQGFPTLDGLAEVIQNNIPFPSSDFGLKPADVYGGTFDVFDNELIVKLQLKANCHKSNLLMFFAEQIQGILKDISGLDSLFDIIGTASSAIPSMDLSQKIHFEANAVLDIALGLNISDIATSRLMTEAELLETAFLRINTYEAGIKVIIDPLEFEFSKVAIKDGMFSLALGVKPNTTQYATPTIITLADLEKMSMADILFHKVAPKPYASLDIELPVQFQDTVAPSGAVFTPIIELRDSNLLDGSLHIFDLDVDLTYFLESGFIRKVTDSLDAVVSGITSAGDQNLINKIAASISDDLLHGIDGRVNFTETLNNYVNLLKKFRQMEGNYAPQLKLDTSAGMGLAQSAQFQETILKAMGLDPLTTKFSDKFSEIQVHLGLAADLASADPDFDIEKLSEYLSLKPEYALTRSNAHAILNLLPDSVKQTFSFSNAVGYPVDSLGNIFDPTSSSLLSDLSAALGGNATFTVMNLAQKLSSIKDTLGLNDDFQIAIFNLLKNRFPSVLSRFETTATSLFPTDLLTGDRFSWTDYLQEVSVVFGMGNTGIELVEDLQTIFGKTPTVQGLMSFVKNIFIDTMSDYFGNILSSHLPFEFEGRIVTKNGERYLLIELVLDFTIPNVVSGSLVNPALDTVLEKLGLDELESIIENAFSALPPNTKIAADLFLNVETGINLEPVLSTTNGLPGLPQVFLNVSKVEILSEVSTSNLSAILDFGPGLSFGVEEASFDISFDLLAAIDKDHPVVVVDDKNNMKFSLTSLWDTITMTSGVNVAIPVRLPLLPSPVVLSLTVDNLFDSISPKLVITSQDFPVSVTLEQFLEPSAMPNDVVVDFLLDTTTGVVSIPFVLDSKKSFTSDAIEEALLKTKDSLPESCPLSIVSTVMNLLKPDNKLLTVGGTSTLDMKSVSIETLTVDPCIMAGKGSSDPFLEMAIHANEIIDVNFLSIESLKLEAAGYFSPTTKERVIEVLTVGSTFWNGSVSADTVLFGIDCTAKAEMDTTFGLNNLVADCTLHKKFFTISAEIGYTNEKCSSQNFGVVDLEIPSVGLVAAGNIMQKAACGIDNEPEYVIDVTASDTMFQGVTIIGPTVSLEQTTAVNSGVATKLWSGQASGGIAIGSHSTMSAVLTFDESEIKTFDATGTFQLGPLSASINTSIADGVISGAGLFDINLKNGAMPQVSAKFEHVATYSVSNAHLPLWSVNGSITDVDIHGVMLDSATVELIGMYTNTSNSADDVAWSGSVAAEGHFLDNSRAQFRVDIDNDEFSSLWANITVTGSNIRFTGEAEITSDHRNARCTAIESEGDLFITGLAQSTTIDFEATSLYNGCAKAGEVLYSMEATVDATIDVYQGLSVKDLTVDVETRVPANPQAGNDWTASIQGTSNLFGASSHAAMTWENGNVKMVHINTAFTTTNGLVSAALEFDYVDDCNVASRGDATATIRLKDLSDLDIVGSVAYNKCTGVVQISGSTALTWNGPTGTSYHSLSVELVSSDNGGDVNAKLATRDWTGTISGMSSTGVSAVFQFDTKNGTVDGMIKFENDKMSVMVAVGTSNCTGRGTLILKDLPHQIPAMEVDVTFSRPGCVEPMWRIEGTLKQLSIPFHGKNLVIDQLSVVVENDVNNKKTVDIRGDFMDGDFGMSLSFGVDPLTDIVFIGEKKSQTDISISSFTSKWYSKTGSTSPFATSTGNPALQSSVSTAVLDNITLKINFSDMYMSLLSKGSLYGLDFQAAIGIQFEGGKWKFGAYFMTSDFNGRTGMPTVIDNVLNGLKPSELSICIANTRMSIEGVAVRKGLSIRIVLGETNDSIQKMINSAPSDIRSQMDGAKTPTKNGISGFVLQADVLSTKEITVFAMLAGNLKMGSGTYLRTLAIAFKITTVPEMGFVAEIDFTVGKGAEQQVLTAGGFIGLDTAGTISIGLSLDSAKPWKNPFGINGVEVLFPLGVEMGIHVSGTPTSFSFFGGMQIGGAHGKVTIGIDLVDFTKTAFKGEIGGLNLKTLIVDVANCKKCVPADVEDLVDGTALELLKGSFNPDPINAVVITAGAASEVIEAGMSVNIKNLKILGILHIESANFKLDVTGVEAGLQLAPVAWGPLMITAAGDASRGPGFQLALTTTKQQFDINGEITVLGMKAMLDLSIGTKGSRGAFSLFVLGLQVDVSLLVQGKPGDKDFKNVIEGSMSPGFINDIIGKAGKFFTDLADKAASFLADKEKKLQAAEAKLQDAQKKLDDAKAKASRSLRSAQDKVREYRIKKQNAKCAKKCKRGWFGIRICWGVFKCWITKQFSKLLIVAEKALGVAEAVTHGLIDVAKGVVAIAEKGRQVALKAVQLAKVGAEKFANLALDRLFLIQRLGFKSVLTSKTTNLDLYADLVILGKDVHLEFSAELTFESVFKNILGTVKKAIL